MSQQTLNKGSNPAALRPGIDGFIGMGYKEKPTQWSQFYEDKSMPYELIRDVGFVGMDLPQRVEEDESNNYTTSRQAWERTYQAAKYRICYAVSEDNMRAIIYPEVVKFRSMEAGKKMRIAEEKLSCVPLNKAVDSSALYAMYDGQPLASTAHVLANGGTFSNRAAAHASLSESVIENALDQIRREYKDDTNNLVQIDAKRLLIPVKLRWEAFRIQNSVLRVNTNFNDPNAIKDMGLLPMQPLVLDYLTDQTAFSILTDAGNGLMHREQWAAETNVWVDNETGATKTRYQKKFTFDVGDFRCIWYMPGA